MSTQPNKGADTCRQIVQAAYCAFGDNDYASAGVRRIVETAGANVAAISYHFGGKKGLYLATAAYLADNLRAGMQAHLYRLRAAIPEAHARECRRLAGELVGRFADGLIFGPRGEDAPGFIFREQNHPTEAFEMLYERLFLPMHETLVRLVAHLRGLPTESDELHIVSHALLGPAIAFRAAWTTMLRHLSRTACTSQDQERIRLIVAALTAAALDHEFARDPHGEPS